MQKEWPGTASSAYSHGEKHSWTVGDGSNSIGKEEEWAKLGLQATSSEICRVELMLYADEGS